MVTSSQGGAKAIPVFDYKSFDMIVHQCNKGALSHQLYLIINDP